jgi:cycloeucalenol cycloisomerase
VLSANPARRRLELFLIAYSVGWIGAIAVAQVTQFFATFGDAAFLAFGVALALPMFVAPAWLGRVAARFAVCVTLLSFVQCYFGSWLFFDVFGMQYRFPTHWIVNRTPLFLYFVTVAYFSTYFLAMGVAWRAFRRRWPSAPAGARVAVRAALAYVTAFAETAAMATPAMRRWFTYADNRAVMLYGSIGYGLVFFITLPLFAELDEHESDARPLGRLVWDLLALNLLILIAYELFAALWRAF